MGGIPGQSSIRDSRRSLWLGVLVLGLAQFLVWLAAGSIVWSFRNLMVGPGSSGAANNTRFAVAIFGAAVVNGFALLIFLRQSRGWGWLILLAVQIGDLVFSLAAGFYISTWWWVITGLGGLTIALLCLGRYVAPSSSGQRSSPT